MAATSPCSGSRLFWASATTGLVLRAGWNQFVKITVGPQSVGEHERCLIGMGMARSFALFLGSCDALGSDVGGLIRFPDRLSWRNLRRLPVSPQAHPDQFRLGLGQPTTDSSPRANRGGSLVTGSAAWFFVARRRGSSPAVQQRFAEAASWPFVLF